MSSDPFGMFGFFGVEEEPPFDPATLPLTGWWRGSYGGSPWGGTASAGVSGSNSLTEATNPPATGTAQNGLVPADFDGANDVLEAAGTLDTYANGSAFSFWVLMLPDDITTGVILQNVGTGFQLYLQSNLVKFYHAAAVLEASRAIASGSYTLITGRFNGSNLTVGVNEAPGSAGGNSTKSTSTAISPLTGAMRLGYSGFLNGRVLDVGLSDTAFSDADFVSIKSYVNNRYALSL